MFRDQASTDAHHWYGLRLKTKGFEPLQAALRSPNSAQRPSQTRPLDPLWFCLQPMTNILHGPLKRRWESSVRIICFTKGWWSEPWWLHVEPYFYLQSSLQMSSLTNKSECEDWIQNEGKMGTHPTPCACIVLMQWQMVSWGSPLRPGFRHQSASGPSLRGRRARHPRRVTDMEFHCHHHAFPLFESPSGPNITTNTVSDSWFCRRVRFCFVKIACLHLKSAKYLLQLQFKNIFYVSFPHYLREIPNYHV